MYYISYPYKEIIIPESCLILTQTTILYPDTQCNMKDSRFTK